MPAYNLERFRTAQDAGHGGFATALAELRAGRKQSHWIWYVFPQLAGLGRSSMARHYGLEGAEEAAAYLRDDVLGAEIDALKLVSCMTLFAQVADRLGAEPHPRFASLREHAEAILAVAARQGYPRCAFTEQQLTSS